MEKIGLYRNGVGAIILNNDGCLLTGEKIGAPSAWQFPQGGVRHRETYEEALYRELKEEIGTGKIVIMSSAKNIMSYLLPKDEETLIQFGDNGNYIGQKQRWFLCRFIGDASDINIMTPFPEFCSYRWSKPDAIVQYAPSFKKDLYLSLLNEFAEHLK